MYDIHNHLIFDVDDGSSSIDESIDMINQMIESGFKGAITTSHFDRGRFVVDASVVISKISKMKEELRLRGIDFKLFPGNEIQIDDMTIGDLKEGRAMSLNNSRYVLSELPMNTMPHYAKGIFYEMRLNRYVPIIAHPERYLYIQRDLNILAEYIKLGCLVQINLDSLTSRDSDVAKEMLMANMVHFVATDAHTKDWRNGLVKDELGNLKEIVGEEKFSELTILNPQKIVDNEYISPRFDDVLINQKVSENNKKRDKWYKFWR